MTKKEFHLGDLLSVTTKIVVSASGIDGLYKILNHMTGTSVFTHQILRVARECTPYILEQYPALKDVMVPESMSIEDRMNWLDEQVKKYGEFFEIDQIKDYEGRNPIEEMEEQMGDKRRVLVIEK